MPTTRQLQLVNRAQTLLASWFGAWGTGDIWRNPTESGGQVGAPALVAASVSGQRRPASEDPRMQKMMPAVTNSARVSDVLKLAAGADIRVGDRWIEAGVTYIVEGVGAWHTATIVALSEVKVQT